MKPPDADAATQQALLASEERYRFLAENIPVQIWTARPDGGLDYASDQTARHFGLTVARLLDEGWQNVVHPEDLPRAVERWVHALGTGETYEVEFRLKRHDGRYAWHLARAVPRRDAAGAIVQWFGTNTDIEEQREAQRRTQALLDEVGAQAREYAAVLAAVRREKDAAEARVAELARQLGRARERAVVMPAATDWHGVALGKVTRVMGEVAGRAVMAETLATMGTTELRSGEDLRAFARLLAARGGFAEAVAGLLSMHAAMYDPAAPA